MILTGIMRMKSLCVLQTLSLTLYLPTASDLWKKAGLLTRFICATFPPLQAVVINDGTDGLRNLQLRV